MYTFKTKQPHSKYETPKIAINNLYVKKTWVHVTYGIRVTKNVKC